MVDPRKKRVLIIGGGFAGLEVAKALPLGLFAITLLDRRNFHLFQPLLYQCATGALSPSEIASPLRFILRDRPDVCVWQGELTDLDASRQVAMVSGTELGFDYLVVATGAGHSYFGHNEWQEYAPGLKTVEDAFAIRDRFFSALERAEVEPDSEKARALTTVVIVGGGPTGVELAGALADVSRRVLVREFRRIDTRAVRILLIEASDRLLRGMDTSNSTAVEGMLRDLGVEVMLNTVVSNITDEGVLLSQGSSTSFISSKTILWAAGVSASPMGRLVADHCGTTVDRAGRVQVNPDLTVGNFPNIFVLGDLASVIDADGSMLPGTAPVAMAEGRYAAATIVARESGATIEPFVYEEKPLFAVVGRNRAVVQYKSFRASGMLVWFAWALVHVLFIIEFRNKLQVMWAWMWSYVTFQVHDRLIIELHRRWPPKE